MKGQCPLAVLKTQYPMFIDQELKLIPFKPHKEIYELNKVYKLFILLHR